MMKIFKWENGGLSECEDFTLNCWVNLTAPSTTEVATLLEKYPMIPRDFLTDPLDEEERPRFDYDDDVQIVILHMPCEVRNENDELEGYKTVPLGIVFAKGVVITVCKYLTSVTTMFIDQVRRKICSPGDRYRFAFRLIWCGAVQYLKYLGELHKETERLEDELHETISNHALLRLLAVEKTLVYFTTSLNADTNALARMRISHQMQLTEDDMDELEDAQIDYKQALETATIHANILNGTLDTFASLINNNLNNVMKYLTAATILLAVPTLIASIYGMNISLPFQQHPHAFSIVFTISSILAFLIALVFYILGRLRRF